MILGVDPGGTTGACLLDLDADRAFVGIQLPASEFGLFAHRLLDAAEPPWVVACERYTTMSNPHQHKTIQNDALEIIGTLRNLCAWRFLEFQLQQRRPMKLVPNTLLRQVGVWAPAREHANEAARQAWLYVARTTARRFFDARSGEYVVSSTQDDDGSLTLEYVDGTR